MELTLPAWARDRATAHPSVLHDDTTNDWSDANCYTDLWIELLHGIGLDPHPVLACTLDLDYEGDQWTFFKPSTDELRRLYGIDVAELTMYRPLPAHIRTQLDRGNVPILEVDAYYLPDSRVAHRSHHTKTTIGVVGIEEVGREVRYLHNAGCHRAVANDYDGLMRVGVHRPADGTLPPYAEVARLDRLRRLPAAELAVRAGTVAAARVRARPRSGALARFAVDIEAALAAVGPAGFAGYAFSTLRQLGAGTALAARLLRWLAAQGGPATSAADDLDAVSASAKRLLLKAARGVTTGRPLAAGATLSDMTAAWARADRQLTAAFRSVPL